MGFKGKLNKVTSERTLLPTGIPYIIANEGAERFSYYGVRAILIVFMTSYLFTPANKPQFSHAEAMVWYHNFMSACYFFPLFGAIIADIFWGKYKTILTLSLFYCLGHLVLATCMDKTTLALGLGLIAIGAGGIKPCISAHLGDQFNKKNYHLLSKVYGWFYFSINIGLLFSAFLTPYLLEKQGPATAFALPALLMFIAVVIFYQGRKKFIITPPIGWQKYKKEILKEENLKTIGNLLIIFSFIAVFYSLWDQSSSSWVLQAKRMDNNIDFGFIKFTLNPAQLQIANPIFIFILIPVFSYFIYPIWSKFTNLTHLKKIITGFFITSLSFMVIAIIEMLIEHQETVNILWQLPAYALLTAGEILIWITSLEFCYIHAPTSMKSLIFGFYMLSISLGNQITAIFNFIITNQEGNYIINNSTYFWFFAGFILIAGLLFLIYAPYFKAKVYLSENKF